MFVGSFITSFVMKPLNKILGRKITFILGGIIGISGCIWITFCLKDDENVKYYIYCATSLIGIGGSTMMVTSLSLVNCLTTFSNYNFNILQFPFFKCCHKSKGTYNAMYLLFLLPLISLVPSEVIN